MFAHGAQFLTQTAGRFSDTIDLDLVSATRDNRMSANGEALEALLGRCAAIRVKLGRAAIGMRRVGKSAGSHVH